MTVASERPKAGGAVKLGIALTAAAALTMVGAVPATAADYTIGPDDIAGYEVGGDPTDEGYNYDQWHIANVDTPGTDVLESLEFGECSVTTLEAVERNITQVLKGFSAGARPTATQADGNAEIAALINSISIDVAEGNVDLQIPMFGYFGGDLEGTPAFTTFRTGSLGAGTHTFSGAITNSQGWNLGETVDEFLDLIEDFVQEDGDAFEILGVGFAGNPGAVVNSISFDGDTYYFGYGDCAPADEEDSTDEDDDDADSGAPTAPTRPVTVDTDR